MAGFRVLTNVYLVRIYKRAYAIWRYLKAGGMMMKVELAIVATHISPAIGYGGVAESTYNLVSCWAGNGSSLTLCSSDASRGARLTPRMIGLPANVRVKLYRGMLFKRWGFGVGALWKVLQACLTARVVYIAGVATWPVTLAAVICSLFHRPFVVSPRGGLLASHVQEIKETKPLKWLFYKFITLPSIRSAKFIHVTGLLEENGVHALIPNIRCETIVNGLDLTQWPVVARKKRAPIIICFVGRVNRDKGINRFAKIWLSERRADDRLIVVGDGDGAYAEELRELAREADGAIELLGNVDRRGVLGALARSHFLVLPSGIEGNNERENFGNVVAEAMATGCPVLVSKGLVWDFIEIEEMGYVFDRNDADIKRILGELQGVSEEKYAVMCDRAAGYADNYLRIENTSAKLWDKLISVN